jgi:hypothetical protein
MRCEQCGRELFYNRGNHSCDGCGQALKKREWFEPKIKMIEQGILTATEVRSAIPSHLINHLDPQLTRMLCGSLIKSPKCVIKLEAV